jgi:hypothetical protein
MAVRRYGAPGGMAAKVAITPAMVSKTVSRAAAFMGPSLRPMLTGGASHQ